LLNRSPRHTEKSYVKETDRLSAYLAGIKASEDLSYADVFLEVKSQSEFRNAFPSVYRGFARTDFSVKSAVQLLVGNQDYMPASWDYTRLLNKKVQSGIKPIEAREQTKEEIAKSILLEIETLGLEEFLWNERYRSQQAKSLEQKEGKGSWYSPYLENAIEFALNNAGHIAKSRGQKVPAIVVQVTSSSKNFIPFHEVEGLMVSHTIPNEIQGLFIDLNTNTGSSGPTWFYVKKDARGRLSVWSTATAKGKWHQTQSPETLLYDFGAPYLSSKFENLKMKYPELSELLNEILVVSRRASRSTP
jgi:hypothetical protein